MPAEQLEHFTIECADLERTRAFYCDLLGLEAGFRPWMAFPGFWLYCGGVPVVHLMKCEDTDRDKDTTGRLDHIAFKCVDPEATLSRLRSADVPYKENRLWDVGLLQVFVHDPDGLQIELNFHGALKKQDAPAAATA
jgi:catechol 2,3-dioxygenase-like lactoylglutathione lyase family enzyme